MLRRQLSDSLVELLIPLLSGIVEDWELQVEIREEAVTIYHRGAALIRHLHLEHGQLVGDIHYKYVPLQRPENTDYLRLTSDSEGLEFVAAPQPLSLKNLSSERLEDYKRMMKSVCSDLEAAVIHGIVARMGNWIVDQELKFQAAGIPGNDKIDLCHFDTRLNALALVEVKGLHDSRLKSRDGAEPEVIPQLRRYRSRIETCRAEILEAGASCIAFKRRLGFANRLLEVPESGPLSLLKKPVLVIGGCSREDVRNILEGEEEWQRLREGLELEAAGIILCGKHGCHLSLRNSGQSIIFDAEIF